MNSRRPVNSNVMPQTFRREDLLMPTDAVVAPNVKQAVPFFMVTDYRGVPPLLCRWVGFRGHQRVAPGKSERAHSVVLASTRQCCRDAAGVLA